MDAASGFPDFDQAKNTQREKAGQNNNGQKTNGPDPQHRPGRILSGADFIAGHVPPVWLVDGIVQRSRLYACTSLTGHGKTAVWLYNGCMIHAGRMIGHLDVFKGNVLFLAGENPSDLKARMIGMAKAYNLDQLPYVLPGGFPMTEEEAVALKRDIAGLGVPLALIVPDTAASYFPGDDENSNVQSGNYARTMRSLTECEGEPAVVALCHPTKGAERKNLLPRGGGAFINELDGNLTLWSTSRGEVTELHWCAKIRGPDFAALGYRLRQLPTGLTDERDRPEITIIAEPMSEEAVADHTKQTLANDNVVLRALRDHPGQSMAQVARAAGWVDANDQPEKWKVQRAIDSLADDKLIQRPRKRAPWEVTEKGREALDKGPNQPPAGLRAEPGSTGANTAPKPGAPAPPPSEAEIATQIDRIAAMSDAAFLALDRVALAAQINCKPHQVAGLRTREIAARAKAEAAIKKATKAETVIVARTIAARGGTAGKSRPGKVTTIIAARKALAAKPRKATKPKARD